MKKISIELSEDLKNKIQLIFYFLLVYFIGFFFDYFFSLPFIVGNIEEAEFFFRFLFFLLNTFFRFLLGISLLIIFLIIYKLILLVFSFFVYLKNNIKIKLL